MNSKFFQLQTSIMISVILFLIILFIYLGYLFNNKRREMYPEVLKQVPGAIEGSVVGIMSLLLGFTFSFVVTKYEVRRHLIVEEMINVHSVILRCDMYPDSIRNTLHGDLKEYLETRRIYYDDGNDEVKVIQALNKSKEISGRMWKKIVSDSETPDVKLRSQQMIPALINMINSIYERDESRNSGVPKLVLWTLLILVLITSFFLGANLSGKKRFKILVLGYALVMALTLNLIIELNTPRSGLINLQNTQQKMNDLIELVKEEQ